jgi:hypothetical protein
MQHLAAHESQIQALDRAPAPRCEIVSSSPVSQV